MKKLTYLSLIFLASVCFGVMRNDLSAEVKNDLVTYNSAIDGTAYVCLGNTVRGDSPTRIYYYSSTSTATADGENVLSATGMGGVGRYIKNNPGSSKRQETYSGVTVAAGTYTVTFPTAYTVAPNIQANIINGTDTQNIRITAVSTTGFTVLVRNRTDVVGLLPSYSNVSGAVVDVIITEK